MAKITITSTSMRVNLTAFEALRALQGSFEVPLGKIRGATDDSGYLKEGLGLRSPGTGFPGLIAEGTFRRDGQRTLSLWRKGQEIVVVELADSKWDRVLIGCTDAKMLAEQINSVLIS